MEKRPLSLTIIGWLLIVGSAIAIIGTLSMGNDPMRMAMLERSPLSGGVLDAVDIGRSIIGLICGWGILKGFNWARYLYVAEGVAGVLFNLFALPMASVTFIGILILSVVAFFLFRPAANAWFKRKLTTAEA